MVIKANLTIPSSPQIGWISEIQINSEGVAFGSGTADLTGSNFGSAVREINANIKGCPCHCFE